MVIHGPLQARDEIRYPGGVSVSCLASRTRHACPRLDESIYGGLTLDVHRHYIGSVTATTHQEKGIITLESNPSQETVLPAPHGKGNKCDQNEKQRKDIYNLLCFRKVFCFAFSLFLTMQIVSKIEKVPRGIRGEKSSKDMASSRNLVSTIGALASPKMGDGTRCPEGYAFPAG